MTTLCQGWLSSLVSFGPYFDAPGVGADRRNPLVLAPIAVFESDAGSIAASVGAPLAFRQAALHLPGAQDDEIAAPDLDVGLLGAGVEFVVGNALAVF